LIHGGSAQGAQRRVEGRRRHPGRDAVRCRSGSVVPYRPVLERGAECEPDGPAHCLGCGRWPGIRDLPARLSLCLPRTPTSRGNPHISLSMLTVSTGAGPQPRFLHPLAGSEPILTEGTSRYTLTRTVTIVGAATMKTRAAVIITLANGRVHQQNIGSAGEGPPGAGMGGPLQPGSRTARPTRSPTPQGCSACPLVGATSPAATRLPPAVMTAAVTAIDQDRHDHAGDRRRRSDDPGNGIGKSHNAALRVRPANAGRRM
jgi:hypothetical protein